MSLIRRAVAASAICLLFAPPSARAQEVGSLPVPVAELSAGYAFMRDIDVDENFPAGWYLSGGVNLNQWFGIVGETGGSYKSWDETFSMAAGPLKLSQKLHVYTFLGGPRFFGKIGRVVPFGQVLAGVAHLRGESTVTSPYTGESSGTGSTTDFALQPGGGVTIYLTERVGVRMAGDFRSIIDLDTLGDETEFTTEFRFITGFTFHWGRR